MADKTEITDIVLYDGSLDELNTCLAQLGDKRRYEFAGVEYQGPWVESDVKNCWQYIRDAGFDGIVNRRMLHIWAAQMLHYQVYGTPIRLVKNNAIPVIDPIIGS